MLPDRSSLSLENDSKECFNLLAGVFHETFENSNAHFKEAALLNFTPVEDF